MSLEIQNGIFYLYQAIKCGNINQIQSLIQNGVDVNPDVKDNSPLHWAIIKLKNKHLNIIAMLLDAGANIHARNYENHTPLDLAIQDGKMEAASLLIRRGAPGGEDLNPLLLKTINKNNDTIVQMLINHGMLYNPAIDFKTLLDAAISQGNPKIIEHILPHCRFLKSADKYIPKDLIMKSGRQWTESVELLLKWNFIIHPNNYCDEEFIYGAVENGHRQIIQRLLTSRININMVNSKTGLNLLTIACLNKHHEIVEQLLHQKAEINTRISFNNNKLSNHSCFRNNLQKFSNLFALDDHRYNLIDITCLHIAVFNSDLTTTKILLKFGAKTKNCADIFNLIYIAVSNSCHEIVGNLLSLVKVTDVDPDGRTLLHCSVNANPNENDECYYVVKLLLERGANIHLKTPGNSLVFEAIKNNHRKIAQLFLDYDADVQYISPEDETLLHTAIKNNFDVKFIITLLKRNIPVNTKNRRGFTPLLDACVNQSEDTLKIIEALIHYNADVNHSNGLLETPLHLVSCGKNLQVVQLLLNKGANPNAMDIGGQTPLHFACKLKSDTTARIIALLLQHGADIEAVDKGGWTPLLRACEASNTAAMECLLNYGANIHAINNIGQRLFHVVSNYFRDWNPEVIQLLVGYNVNIECVDQQGWTPLLRACERYYPAVKCLLENHADPNATNSYGETSLHVVCHSRSDMPSKIIEVLLEYGANIEAVDTEGWTPLFTACNNGNTEAVKCLLENHANIYAVDYNGQTPFHVACTNYTWNQKMMQLLLQYNRNIESKDKQGWTPLFIACHYQCVPAVKYLLENHANPNATDENSQTPLHIVCQQNRYERNLVELLLKYGANVDATDNIGFTPLLRACYCSGFEIIELLLRHNANPNHTNRKNVTPLHIAVRKACISVYNSCKYCHIVELLIKYGANVDAVDKNNQTPLHYAVKEIVLHSDKDSDAASLWRRNCAVVVIALVLQGIKLKTAGIKLKNHKSNVDFSSDQYITIDNVEYSANDILRLNIDPPFKDFRIKMLSHVDMWIDKRDIKIKCEEEIDKMKTNYIGIDDVTYYDLLIGNIHFLSRLAPNKNIQLILQTAVFDAEFPLYIDILRNRLINAKKLYERNTLCMNVKEYFTLNVNERLLHECIDMILIYLNNEELQTFIEGIKSLNA